MNLMWLPVAIITIKHHNLHATMEWDNGQCEWICRKLELEARGWKREIQEHLLSDENYNLLCDTIKEEMKY